MKPKLVDKNSNRISFAEIQFGTFDSNERITLETNFEVLVPHSKETKKN